ncbi:MAG: hypothetical protein RIR11_77 [Bacteroidota bacterium]
MISNYLSLALRNLGKNRLYTFLNIFGLAVGLGTSILILLWVTDELSYDKFHEKLPNIHRIMQHQTQGGVTYTFSSTPGPLAAALRTELPEIERAARTSWSGQQLLSRGDKNTYERGVYAEPDYFNIFTFPAIAGDPVAALRDPGAIVITERTAKKFFGNEDPIGKILRHDNQRDLKVAAVVRDLPANSSIRFDVVLPFRVYELQNPGGLDSWGSNSMPTYVELKPNTNVEALNNKLVNFIQGKNAEAQAHIFAFPIKDWRLRSEFKDGKPNGGRITMVLLLGIIGIFVLLIACINFMNLATARSEHRSKEVGVRKTMGALRWHIIAQFLSEAMLMTFMALILGIVFALLALPSFNRFFEKSLTISLSNWPLWLGLLGMGLITGLVAGSYPAFFLSSFDPIRVLKGSGVVHKGRSSIGSKLRKGLVTFQFVVSIFLIISTIVIYKQLEFAQSRKIGYDSECLIEIPARGDMQDKFGVTKAELLQIPSVKSVAAGTDDLIQFGSNTSGLGWPGKTDEQNFLVTVTSISHDWTKTAGVKVVEGRDFSPEYGGDTLCCMLNQAAVKQMGLASPVLGTQIRQDTNYTVIGVIEDFSYNDPLSATMPMILFLNTRTHYNYFVRFQNDENWQKSLSQVEAAVKKVNPNYPFEFHFTKEEYQKNFDEIRSTGQLANMFGGIAILISCLGLFGLSAFVAEQRKKEISIRKVLGATVANIWLFLSRDFLGPVLIAFVLAAPIASWLMQKLLSRFEYHIELSWWMFALAGLAALLIAIFTVSYQGIKAALVNPVKALKSE